jgi:hypothetical protein
MNEKLYQQKLNSYRKLFMFYRQKHKPTFFLTIKLISGQLQ